MRNEPKIRSYFDILVACVKLHGKENGYKVLSINQNLISVVFKCTVQNVFNFTLHVRPSPPFYRFYTIVNNKYNSMRKIGQVKKTRDLKSMKKDMFEHVLINLLDVMNS